MSDLLKAREENLAAAHRRVARAALEMEDATAALRASLAAYNEAVRARVADIERASETHDEGSLGGSNHERGRE